MDDWNQSKFELTFISIDFLFKSSFKALIAQTFENNPEALAEIQELGKRVEKKNPKSSKIDVPKAILVTLITLLTEITF